MWNEITRQVHPSTKRVAGQCVDGKSRSHCLGETIMWMSIQNTHSHCDIFSQRAVEAIHRTLNKYFRFKPCRNSSRLPLLFDSPYCKLLSCLSFDKILYACTRGVMSQKSFRKLWGWISLKQKQQLYCLAFPACHNTSGLCAKVKDFQFKDHSAQRHL